MIDLKVLYLFKKNNFPSVLLYGSLDNQKVSIIKGVFSQFFKNLKKTQTLHINAIEKTQIANLNKKIHDFKQNSFYSKEQMKIIVFENFEFMGNLGQMSMREKMQKTDINIKFWIITRFFSKINQTILSRCVFIHFKPNYPSSTMIRMVEILNKENLCTSIESLQYSLRFNTKGSENFCNLTFYTPYYEDGCLIRGTYFYHYRTSSILQHENFAREEKYVFFKKLFFHNSFEINFKEKLNENYANQLHPLISLIKF